MRIGYFDCFSGASGDMLLGAFLDAGCPQAELRAGLDRLNLPDARLEVAKVRKQGFAATRALVQISSPPGHRHLRHIRDIITAAGLPPRVSERAIAIFTRLAEAEAAAHGSTIEKIHFHEVGAADAIFDIVGASLCVEILGLDQIACSPIPTGSGTVKCEHGVMPIPAPGTAALLVGVPLATTSEPGELTTPTGAAILTTLAGSYGPMPAMRLERVGSGAGTRDGVTQPNILRLFIGQAAGRADAGETDRIEVLEANLDDCTPEAIGFAVERLFAAGALDVFLTPIQMKKSRPGVQITVLSTMEQADSLEAVLFSETTTFGVRRSECARSKLSRRRESVSTRFGEIAVKIGTRAGNVISVSPEFEDCARLAREQGIPLREVMAEAAERWRALRPPGGPS